MNSGTSEILRLGRNEISDLPRPVYEVLAEIQDDGFIVALMTDASATTRVELFAFPEKAEDSYFLRTWLLTSEVVPLDDPSWSELSDTIAERLIAFVAERNSNRANRSAGSTPPTSQEAETGVEN